MDPEYRKQRILQAASGLIAHYGYDKTTMEDIARETGVSKGALYLAWPGKEQLFDALLAFEMRRLLADLRARLEADPGGGRIANLYRHTLEALQANPLMRALYTRDGRILGDFVHRQDTGRYTSRLMLGKDLIGGMQAAGIIRADLDAAVIAQLFAILALGFMSIGTVLPENDAPPMEKVVEGIASMVESGLCVPGSEQALSRESIQRMMNLLEQQYQ